MPFLKLSVSVSGSVSGTRPCWREQTLDDLPHPGAQRRELARCRERDAQRLRIEEHRQRLLEALDLFLKLGWQIVLGDRGEPNQQRPRPLLQLLSRGSGSFGRGANDQRTTLDFSRFLARITKTLGRSATLKGGVVLELRLPEKARTTKDIDLGLHDTSSELGERDVELASGDEGRRVISSMGSR